MKVRINYDDKDGTSLGGMAETHIGPTDEGYRELKSKNVTKVTITYYDGSTTTIIKFPCDESCSLYSAPKNGCTDSRHQ